ncbi:MAG: hypothetical protein IT165_32075 [Bryobacterales bacterium]|nr:hypothetical protein [Bryobacterales bacterium]
MRNTLENIARMQPGKIVNRYNLPLFASSPNMILYSAKENTAIKSDQILYFASSIFWRSAATDWPGYGRLEMGRYEERFRQYLLNQEAFPQDVTLFLYISSPKRAERNFLFPVLNLVERRKVVSFFIPGMLFNMFLGHMEQHDTQGSFSSPQRVIVLSDQVYKTAILTCESRAKSADPKGYLRDYLPDRLPGSK